MTSRSARITSERPFYDLHADAYDALVMDPVEPWAHAVGERLRDLGLRSASILEAGCGTGRHAAALIERGHRVTLLDASSALLAIAVQRCPDARALLADICAPDLAERFDAVTCRGVLNDLVEDGERDAALNSFAALTRPDGLLVLDVRESEASQRRADGRWRTAEAQLAGGDRLNFSSRPLWRADRIVVEERYELVAKDGARSPARGYTFEMRPWTRNELEAGLSRAGFEHVEITTSVGRRTPDRLLVTARR